MIRKVRQHITQNEELIFERSSPGKVGYQLPDLDVPEVDPVKALGAAHVRSEIEGAPEVSEVEVIRHFTRLSTWNYAIDLGMYPLGSCTMKYNPRVNELVARLDGMAWPGCGDAATRGGRARRVHGHSAGSRAAGIAR
jgi:glycine dehydrogenase subunit 2